MLKPNPKLSTNLLEVNALNVSIGEKAILKNVSFSVGQGEVVGLVGESGSGKSMTALSIMKLLPRSFTAEGSILLNRDGTNENLIAASEPHMCTLRGDDIGMVFQEPMTALNPVKTIGEQVAEGIRLHTGTSKANAYERAAQILDRVGMPTSKFPLSRYPHELSGGQRQRVVIAIACALNPKLLIADEPTTALDVTLQAQILDLLRELVAENNMGLILITHDLAVVAEMADRIIIMRDGEIMEQGETTEILINQTHPYTRALAKASTHVPKRTHRVLTSECEAAGETPLLKVRNLVCEYPTPRKSLFRKSEPFRAVNDVTFNLYDGQSVGLVGESGCGKSTLARAILALEPVRAGSITFSGVSIGNALPDAIRQARLAMQVVFQDPYGSFNPRHKVERLVAEPLHLIEHMSESEKRDRVVEALEAVGLQSDDIEKYPHEFSGGQRQRIGIARALITNPKLLIADEPVSALDVSIRAQVLDLFNELRERVDTWADRRQVHKLAFLFISHDLSVVRAITDEVMIMNAGKIIESGPTGDVFDNPQTSYAKTLISAAPNLDQAIKSRQKRSGK